jgi:hypothetical protein
MLVYLCNDSEGRVYVGIGTYESRARASMTERCCVSYRILLDDLTQEEARLIEQDVWELCQEMGIITLNLCPPKDTHWSLGVGGNPGQPKSLEHRAKLTANKLGTKASEETRQKLSESHVIAMNRPEVREKQAAAQRGKKHTDEHKAKISEAVKATKAQMDCSYGPRTEEEKQNLSQKISSWWSSLAGQAERERRKLKRLEGNTNVVSQEVKPGTHGSG